ncbi:MAG: cation transporter [Gammaproteobacteria bacterium]|nr:cation transporter [Gammaproteobacteria bacterium]NNJ92390.1 cation transporter [Gammaproteobacteria bacterium]
MSDCDCSVEITDRSQSHVLIKLLAINATMFVLELGIGLYAQSTGLIADAIDMLADSIVYAIGLYAVGHSLTQKANAALLSGWFQLGLGLLILSDIIRRIFIGSEPVSVLMMSVGTVALIANIVCLKLIQEHRHGEVHMRASWIFSKNDVIANAGVILGGLMVWLLDSRWPDLIIGSLIALLVLNGAKHIIQDARKELASESLCGEGGDCCSSATVSIEPSEKPK